MTAALAERRVLAALVCGALALGLGALTGAQPKLALGLVVVIVAGLIAFRAPVANLILLLLLTGLVPYDVQNRFGVGGGVNSPGLLLSDLFLLAGLAWALPVLSGKTLDRRSYVYSVLVAIFLAVVALQFLHGLHAGLNRSRVGEEARVLLGFGAFLIAVPLLTDPRARRRLLVALGFLAFALGAWGMIQWFGHLSYGVGVGVRAGVSLTTTGTGQLQGGEYAFPAVVVICCAVLIVGGVRSARVRAALVATTLLNAAACLVTFERTFWLDALVGVFLVILRANSVQRFKALLITPLVAIAAVGVLAVVAPRDLTTAQQRLLSLGQYSNDKSVHYRVVESSFVLQQIRAHPFAGSGLAATIFWGQPWNQVPPRSSPFAHDGYLWLAWKLGIPGAALLLLLLGAAMFLRGPPGESDLDRAVRIGAQGALAGLLLATITFPSVSNLSITPAMGVLLALAVVPSAATQCSVRSRDPAPR
jgi:O-antigen ligase